MEETRREKLMGWIGDHKVISGIIFSLLISAIAGLGIKLFVNLMWPSEVTLESAPVDVIPFSTGQYDEETTTGFLICKY